MNMDGRLLANAHPLAGGGEATSAQHADLAVGPPALAFDTARGLQPLAHDVPKGLQVCAMNKLPDGGKVADGQGSVNPRSLDLR
jgi:hypothetical protein